MIKFFFHFAPLTKFYFCNPTLKNGISFMTDLFHTFSGNIFLVFGHQKIINSWKHFQNFLQKEKKTFPEQIMWDKTKTKKDTLGSVSVLSKYNIISKTSLQKYQIFIKNFLVKVTGHCISTKSNA